MFSDWEIKRLRDTFFGGYQRLIRHELMYSADIEGNSNASVASDPTKMWVTDRANNPVRINSGTLNPNMPAGVPLQVGKVLGFNDQYPEAKAVANYQYAAPTGATYTTAWVGANHAIAYAATNGQLTSDVNKFAFFSATSQGLMQGNSQTSWTLDTYNSGATNGSFVNAHVAEGTLASPSAVTSGKLLMYFGVYTFGATVFGTNYDGRLKFFANETHTDTAHGTRGVLSATVKGTVVEVDVLQWDENGLTLNRGLVTPPVTVSDANYTAIVSDLIISYITLSAARTVALPAVANVTNGKRYIVNDETGTASAFNIIIDPSGSETINGATTFVIGVDYGSVEFEKRGSAWFII